MFGHLADSSAADWVGAIGTIVATVVTAIIALSGYFRDINLKTESARNSTMLAVGIADRAASQLEAAENIFNCMDNVRHGAKYFLSYPIWIEVIESINELRPQDMPDIYSTESYISLRSIIRSITKILQGVADLPAGTEMKITMPDLSDHAKEVRRLQGQLQRRVEDLAHPFRPKWIKVLVLKNELRRLKKVGR